LLCNDTVIKEIINAAEYSDSIIQSYIQIGDEWNLRIRETRAYDPDEDSDKFRVFNSKYVNHVLTYKHKIDGELVEIETDISSEDYEKLRRRALSKLNKRRYRVFHGPDAWEIDLFYRGFADDLPYFVLAEFEMPPGQIAPVSIPPIISEHLLYEVPIGNNKFSNTKLCHAKYAEEKYKELLEARFENE